MQSASYMLEEISKDGLDAAMRALVRVAEEGERITYGRIAHILERELSIEKINPRHLGYVAGPLMTEIQKKYPNAPLINLLVVDQTHLRPGDGANMYIKKKYSIKGRLSEAKRVELVQDATNEVWAYKDWKHIYEAIFGQKYVPLELSPADDRFDRDGKADNPKYGAGVSEGPEHKKLKQFVAKNPSCLRLALGNPRTETEKALLSGDVMDVQIIDGARRFGIEVKSRISGRSDLQRGIFQCIKYQAVLVAQSGFSDDDALCEAILVTEEPLPGDLAALARYLGIRHRVIKVP